MDTCDRYNYVKTKAYLESLKHVVATKAAQIWIDFYIVVMIISINHPQEIFATDMLRAL